MKTLLLAGLCRLGREHYGFRWRCLTENLLFGINRESAVMSTVSESLINSGELLRRRLDGMGIEFRDDEII